MIITHAQMRALSNAARERFAASLCDGVRSRCAPETEHLDGAVLRRLLRSLVEQGCDNGLSTDRDLRAFAEMSLILGEPYARGAQIAELLRRRDAESTAL